MSVLINGMEMPKSCEDCPFGWYTRTGEKFCLTMIHGWQSNCPLVPIPDHGDLIERDALERNLIKMQQAQNNLVARGIRKSRAVARDLPTIIPADKEGAE